LNGKPVNKDTARAVAQAAAAAADPTGDFHASAEYRKALVGTLVERALAAAAARKSKT
jgi:3-oxo-Delta1-steroid hydratase/dehydrogenase medium subunit